MQFSSLSDHAASLKGMVPTPVGGGCCFNSNVAKRAWKMTFVLKGWSSSPHRRTLKRSINNTTVCCYRAGCLTGMWRCSHHLQSRWAVTLLSAELMFLDRYLDDTFPVRNERKHQTSLACRKLHQWGLHNFFFFFLLLDYLENGYWSLRQLQKKLTKRASTHQDSINAQRSTAVMADMQKSEVILRLFLMQDVKRRSCYDSDGDFTKMTHSVILDIEKHAWRKYGIVCDLCTCCVVQ